MPHTDGVQLSYISYVLDLDVYVTVRVVWVGVCLDTITCIKGWGNKKKLSHINWHLSTLLATIVILSCPLQSPSSPSDRIMVSIHDKYATCFRFYQSCSIRPFARRLSACSCGSDLHSGGCFDGQDEREKVQCTPGKVESVLSTLVCSQVKLFHVVDLKNKKPVIYDQYTFKHAWCISWVTLTWAVNRPEEKESATANQTKKAQLIVSEQAQIKLQKEDHAPKWGEEKVKLLTTTT
jgi:hypothetical protein